MKARLNHCGVELEGAFFGACGTEAQPKKSRKMMRQQHPRIKPPRRRRRSLLILLHRGRTDGRNAARINKLSLLP